MKIHCSKGDLSKGVQIIQSALSARTTLPILLNFLMETENAKLKLTSTDLQMGVKHYIPADIETAGSITIPARKFYEILQTLQDSQEIGLDVDSGGRVHLNSGRSRFSLSGMPKSEYPLLPECDKSEAFSIPSGVLSDMLRKTVFASAGDETRHVLNGVFWAASGDHLDLVATDGRRLAAVRRKCLSGHAEFRVTVPNKILAELLRLLGSEGDRKASDPVSVGVTANQIAFYFQETTILSRLVDGSYPNYEHVIPSQRDHRASLATGDLAAITKKASLCALDQGGIVRYAFRPGVLHVSASSQTMEFEDEIAADYQGSDIHLAFNPHYILDGLKNIGSEKVVFSFTTEASPVLIEAEGDPGYQYVVMPIRGRQAGS